MIYSKTFKLSLFKIFKKIYNEVEVREGIYMAKKILNAPTATISDVKKSPMDVFRKATNQGEGVYILNRKKIEGVMLTQKQYEALIEENDYLNDKIVELIAEKRLLDKSPAAFSDREVRGKVANKEPIIDKLDGFE
jgi:PHD/YefM family antitoxin component YafN of YafNO toxin-antitoxin module